MRRCVLCGRWARLAFPMALEKKAVVVTLANRRGLQKNTSLPCPSLEECPALGGAGCRARKRRTRTEKKNTGQEPEQKRQNTGVRVLPVAQCAAADGRRATGDARWANTNDPPEGSWGVGQLDTSYRVYYHQSYTISTTEEARDQVTPFVSSIQCPIEGGEFEQKETILLPS